MSRHRSELTDEQWSKLEPLVPRRASSRKGGRPPISDRACFEGILWVLRSGARWRDLPPQYPSPTTCWRRLQEWKEAGIWLAIWRKFLGELDEEGILSWDETFSDGTFSPAKKASSGESVGENLFRQGSQVVIQGRFVGFLGSESIGFSGNQF